MSGNDNKQIFFNYAAAMILFMDAIAACVVWFYRVEIFGDADPVMPGILVGIFLVGGIIAFIILRKLSGSGKAL